MLLNPQRTELPALIEHTRFCSAVPGVMGVRTAGEQTEADISLVINPSQSRRQGELSPVDRG